jgi:hypothetical protein
MYPLANVPPSSLEFAAVPLTDRNDPDVSPSSSLELTAVPFAGKKADDVSPSSSLAFRFGTWMLLLTASGGSAAADDRLRAVPFSLVSEVTVLEELTCPERSFLPWRRRPLPTWRRTRQPERLRWLVLDGALLPPWFDLRGARFSTPPRSHR